MPGHAGMFQCGIFDRTFAIYSSLVSFFIPLTLKVFADLRSVCILRRNTQLQRSAGSSQHRPDVNSSVTTALARDTTLQTLGSGHHHSDAAATTTSQQLVISDAASHSGAPHTVLVLSERPNTRPATPEPSSGRSGRSQPRVGGDGQQMAEQEDDGVQTDSDRTLAAAVEMTLPALPGCSRHGSRRYAAMRTRRAATNAKKSAGRERRAEKTLIWVFVCFVGFWLPFFCANFLYGVCEACAAPDHVFLAFSWLGYASSGVNPCIYTLLNRDFRRAFRNIVSCRFQRASLNGGGNGGGGGGGIGGAKPRRLELDST